MISKISSRFGKGFTLIELMIVVAIIGILAAIAIPNFVKFQCRSKQSEAKTNLKALYVAEESYYAEQDQYLTIATCDQQACVAITNDAGWSPKGDRIRYSYATTATASATAPTFVGLAGGSEASVNTDSWQITQANDLVNKVNACD